MANTNVDVVVQKVNKPQTRAVVGCITMGCKPDDADYDRWGVRRDAILSESLRTVSGHTVYLIVEM